jgi:allophanate hydrolase
MTLPPLSRLVTDPRALPSGLLVTETITSIVAAHISGIIAPADTLTRSFARIRAHGDAAVFISLRDEAAALAEAKALAAAGPQGRPLYGVPVAIKDNIDVAGLPTTAACPAFAYNPGKDATVVARLKSAGAIVIGNQFTVENGLVYAVAHGAHAMQPVPS